MFIEAVLEETVAVTPAPVKFKKVAVPCAVPSSATVTPDAPALRAYEAVRAKELDIAELAVNA